MGIQIRKWLFCLPGGSIPQCSSPKRKFLLCALSAFCKLHAFLHFCCHSPESPTCMDFCNNLAERTFPTSSSQNVSKVRFQPWNLCLHSGKCFPRLLEGARQSALLPSGPQGWPVPPSVAWFTPPFATGQCFLSPRSAPHQRLSSSVRSQLSLWILFM